MNESLGEIVLFGRSVQIDQRNLVNRVMMFRKDSNCRTAGAPRGGLWSLADLGTIDSPSAPRGGPRHFGLVEHMVGHWCNLWSVTKITIERFV